MKVYFLVTTHGNSVGFTLNEQTVREFLRKDTRKAFVLEATEVDKATLPPATAPITVPVLAVHEESVGDEMDEE